jgi:hypothetical protein
MPGRPLIATAEAAWPYESEHHDARARERDTLTQPIADSAPSPQELRAARGRSFCIDGATRLRSLPGRDLALPMAFGPHRESGG